MVVALVSNSNIFEQPAASAATLQGSAHNERPTLSRERWKGDELVPPKGFTQTSPDLAMQVPEGAGGPSPARPDQTVSQPDPPAATGALNEILREFDPSPLLVNPSSSSSAQKTTRPRPTLEDVMSQLRNLRLVRGISLADLKSTCDAGGDVKLTKDDLLKILLRVAWHIIVSDMTVRHCAPVFLLNLFIYLKSIHPIVASRFPPKWFQIQSSSKSKSYARLPAMEEEW